MTLVFKHHGERIEGELVDHAGRFALARASQPALPAPAAARRGGDGRAGGARLRRSTCSAGRRRGACGSSAPAGPRRRRAAPRSSTSSRPWPPSTPTRRRWSTATSDSTYGELERRADLVACWIEAAGAVPEDRIGVLMGRSDRLVAALLGVLAAGCAYVPLDPEWPEERIGFVLADAGCRGLLTDPEPSGRAAGAPGFRLAVSDRLLAAAPPARARRRRPLPGQLACVISTSGSTGVPKGVMIRAPLARRPRPLAPADYSSRTTATAIDGGAR